MKVMLTLDFPPERGGIQHYIRERAASMYTDGDKIIVGCRPCDRRRRDTPGPQVVRLSTPLSRFNKKFSLFPLAWEALKLYRRHEQSLIFECANMYAAIAPWLLSWFYPLRYRVFTYGGELVALRSRPLRRLLFTRILRKAERLYAIGEYGRRRIRALHIAAPIALEPPRMPYKDAMARFHFDKKRLLRILAVGRLTPHKGHAALLRAAALLPRDRDWRLTVIGDGPCYKELVALRNTMRFGERVRIIRNADDAMLEKEYQRAGIFVLPSIETKSGAEGFGIVLLEAMAHGLAIIAARSGGIPEVLGNGAYGVLTTPGNIHEIKNAIIDFWRSPGSARAFAQRARRRRLQTHVRR